MAVATAGVAAVTLLAGYGSVASTFSGSSSSEDASEAAAEAPAGRAMAPVVSPRAQRDLPGVRSSLGRVKVIEVAELAVATNKGAQGATRFAALIDAPATTREVQPAGGQNKRVTLTRSLRIYDAIPSISGTGAQVVATATVPVDDHCRSISASAQGVAVACEGHLYEYDSAGKQRRDLPISARVLSGTFLASGEAAASVEGESKLRFYSPEGEETGKTVVSRALEKVLLVRNDAAPDRVAVIDRSQSSISDVDVAKRSLNGALRIGQGVGSVAASPTDDGVVVASDAKQGQLLVFTMTDVVRLHQAAPTGKSPWAVQWDPTNAVAWVSTTEDNRVAAYSIASGTPLRVAEFATIANVRGIIAAEGAITLVASDGATQYIDWAAVARDIAKGKAAVAADPKRQYPVVAE